MATFAEITQNERINGMHMQRKEYVYFYAQQWTK